MKVIYFDIDTLRPDHLGCYGYSRPTSPVIDSLAANGLRFTSCYAACNPCMPARATIWTGNHAIKNGVVTHGPRSLVVNRQAESIPAWLRKHGIYCATVSSFGRHPSPWFFDGWHNIIDPHSQFGHFQMITADDVNGEAIPWIERNQDKDFFLHVHYWDPHHPLKAPQEYVDKFTPAPLPPYPTPDMIARQQADCHWQCAGMKDVESMEDLQYYLGEYDAEIAGNDAKLGEVIQKLRNLNIFEDTLIIISSDHGEEFGEHGLYGEHATVFEETSHVPLIMHCPKFIKGGQVSDAMVYSMDIGPTAVAAFGLPVAEKWDGRPTIDLNEDRVIADRNYLVFDHGLYTSQRAIRKGDWKLIRTYHPGDRQLPEVMLFNLTDDPWEQENLAESRPAKREELLTLLAQWERENNVTGTDPLMVNTEQGPFGTMAYGKSLTDQYRQTGKKWRTKPTRNA